MVNPECVWLFEFHPNHEVLKSCPNESEPEVTETDPVVPTLGAVVWYQLYLSNVIEISLEEVVIRDAAFEPSVIRTTHHSDWTINSQYF
jgi:hypothetical protein